MLVDSGRAWASSSVVEQGTFNPRVVGSIPTWLTPVAGGSDRASSLGRSAKLSKAGPTRLVSPHRLEAQDTALSRRRHGFESRWGHSSAGQ